MSQYRVHVYNVCHAKLSAPVDASTHQRAAQKVMHQLHEPHHELSLADIFENRSASEYVEHDEGGDLGFLVDRVGDDEFSESSWFTLDKEGKVISLDVPSRMFTQNEDREIAKLKTLLHDIQQQLDTDSDLAKITGAAKYKTLSERIKEVLGIHIELPGR